MSSDQAAPNEMFREMREKKAPFLIDPAALCKAGLSEHERWEDNPTGNPRRILSQSFHRGEVLYLGDVCVALAENGPCKVEAVDQGYEEALFNLDGQLTLVDERGETHEFGPGDFLVIPKGFTGTWEVSGNSRHMVVIDSAVSMASMMNEPPPSKKFSLTDSGVELTDAKGSPLRVELDGLTGEGLPYELQPRTDRAVGNPRRALTQSPHRAGGIFCGDFYVGIYESAGPSIMELVDTLYDEFLRVLDGEFILTDTANGGVHKFTQGDFVIVPKGFTGTWEITSDLYRELIVIESSTMVEDGKAD